MSVSLMTMEPFSGFSRPTSDLRKTDFPVPEGPSSTEISPGGNVSVTSLQMFWLPKDLERPSTSTATPTTACPPLRLLCRFPPRRNRRAPAVCDVADGSASGRPQRALLTGNDGAGNRLRVSPVFRDPSLQTSLHGARDSPAPVTRQGPPSRRRTAPDDLRWCIPRLGRGGGHLTETVAPAPSRAALAFSAASLATF